MFIRKMIFLVWILCLINILTNFGLYALFICNLMCLMCLLLWGILPDLLAVITLNSKENINYEKYGLQVH